MQQQLEFVHVVGLAALGDPSLATGPRAAGVAPPRLVGGANSQFGEYEEFVRIDWLSYSGPAAHVLDLVEFISEKCGLGRPDPDNRKGGKFYKYGYHWGSAALLYNDLDDAQGHFLLQLPGESCQLLRQYIRLAQLCKWLHLSGCKPTRVDIAVDFYRKEGEPIKIVERIFYACVTGELASAKRWSPGGSFRLRAGQSHADGASVSIGRRGKLGSGRYVVAYDKGLETASLPQGRWQRLEARFSGDAAAILAEPLTHDNGEQHLRPYAMGAVDFLDNPGKRRRERTRCQWWQDILDGQPAVKITPPRIPNSLDGVSHWLKKAVLPALVAYSATLKLDISDTIRKLIFEPIEPSNRSLHTDAFLQWCIKNNITLREGRKRARDPSNIARVFNINPMEPQWTA